MELQHSQTWKNLQTAFSGELHACAKYKIYALRAREDGYEQMGNIFDETSRNEQEHAEIWLKHLSGGEVPGTLENLRDAAVFPRGLQQPVERPGPGPGGHLLRRGGRLDRRGRHPGYGLLPADERPLQAEGLCLDEKQ